MNLLRRIMEKGASQPWRELLQEVIGDSRLDGTALREYFSPLEEWLRQENLRNNEFVGWIYDGDYCKSRWIYRYAEIKIRILYILYNDIFINYN